MAGMDLEDILQRMGYEIPQEIDSRYGYARDSTVAVAAKRELEAFFRTALASEVQAETYKTLAMETVRKVATLELEVERLKARADIVGDEMLVD